MQLRYTDLDTPVSEYNDFVIRRRFPTLLELFVICITAIVFGAGIAMSTHDKITLMSILFTLGGCLCLYTVMQIKRSRDLLQATEFQNALFGSALNADCVFCTIAHNNGNIFYLSPAFKQFFPDFIKTESTSIRTWVEMSQISPEASDAIFTAIEQTRHADVDCTIKDQNHQPHKFTLFIEPIARPHGFLMIRGREQK